MPRGRKPRYPANLTIRGYLLRDQKPGRGHKAITEDDLDRGLDAPFDIPSELTTRPVRGISVHELDLPSRALGPIRKLRIRTVADLMAARRADLLSQDRFGEITLKRIRRELLDLLFPRYIGEGEANAPTSFQALVKCFVLRAIDDDRKASLTLGRLAPTAQRPQPLREFGQRYDLSRERIRQIVDDAFSRLRKPALLAMLNPFWREVCAILESWQRPIPLARLADALTRRYGWRQTPPGAALGRLLALNYGLTIKNESVCLARLLATGRPRPGGGPEGPDGKSLDILGPFPVPPPQPPVRGPGPQS